MTDQPNQYIVLDREIEKLRCSSQPIILFGAGIIGSCVYRALKQIGVMPACFCDNDTLKIEHKFEGLDVVAPYTAYSNFNNPIVIVCLSSLENFKIVEKQLLEIGYTDIRQKDLYYLMYQLHVLNRPVSESKLLNTLDIVKRKADTLTLHMVGVVVTQICTLKCKDCSLLIPQYAHPYHYSKNDIVDSVVKLAASVDAIEAVTLLGGESLLHPEILDICAEVAKIGNVDRVHILTNGTLLPNKDLLESLRPYITFLIINDYGELSHAKKSLVDACEELDIVYQIYPNAENWYEMQKTGLPLRNHEDARTKFVDCIWGKSYMEIQNGKFHICGFSAAGTELGFVKNNEADYIDLLNTHQSNDDVRKSLNKLLHETSPLTACQYCGLDFNTSVQRALQK